MRPLLINTTPQTHASYAVKVYEDISFSLPYHMHKRYELTLILKGEGIRIIGDRIDYFKSGDLLLLSPMLPHQWQSSLSKNNDKVKAITLFFDANFPSNDFWHLKEANDIRHVLIDAQRGIQLTGELQKDISRRLKEAVGTHGFRGIILILEMLQTIACLKEYELVSSHGYLRKGNIDTNRINVIIDYIFDHLHTKIRLAELAELVHLHPGSLSREFKKTTGFSIVEYINKVRIGKATSLLIETDMQIMDICYETGFRNLSNFNRQFKKIKEATPSEFRKHTSDAMI